MNKHIWIGIALAIFLTATSYGIAVFTGLQNFADISYIEVFAVATTYVCTYLCNFQSRWNYPFGIVSVAAFGVMFFNLGLYASMLLQIYLIPTLIYGWFIWKEDTNTKPVEFVKLKMWPVYIGVAAAFYALVYFTTNSLPGASFALTDSALLVLSILAQFLLDRKKPENWAIWFVVNILSIWEYASAGAFATSMQFILFVANCIWGAYLWINSMKRSEIES